MSIYDYDNDFDHYECDENKHSIMERYYNISANEHEPILLEKLNMTAIWKCHGKYGFAMISANRSDMSVEYNEKRHGN